MGLYCEFVSVGLKGFDGDPEGTCAEPRRPVGKFSFIGERAEGSNVDLVGELWNPCRPKPVPSCLSSGSGLGVCGKTKVGMLEVMLGKLLSSMSFIQFQQAGLRAQ